ncbi:DUF6441 family protein [Caenispirillum bisanense]|uniref:Prophage minor tail protein Z (GPZ) n=1 Tax=Caenispirillum bisanense TaxID=414052 RepID=A0A286GPA7_9PROT|nr:DUF6441 family protein [Caenispirillum bisanense]SOD97016.1 hypothetical protein SAMN05421508_106209 [Caenispirillum bisanense]
MSNQWFNAAIQGRLKEQIAREQKHVRDSLWEATREATQAAKTGIRQATTSAGLGQRLANTWRSKEYQKDTAGFIYTKASYILESFLEAQTIKAKNGKKYLAIPTQFAPKRGRNGKRLRPANYPGELAFVPGKRGNTAMLVDVRKFTTGKDGKSGIGKARKTKSGAFGKGTATVSIFFLVKQIRTRKRVDLSMISNKYQLELIKKAVQKLNDPNR